MCASSSAKLAAGQRTWPCGTERRAPALRVALAAATAARATWPAQIIISRLARPSTQAFGCEPSRPIIAIRHKHTARGRRRNAIKCERQIGRLVLVGWFVCLSVCLLSTMRLANKTKALVQFATPSANLLCRCLETIFSSICSPARPPVCLLSPVGSIWSASLIDQQGARIEFAPPTKARGPRLERPTRVSQSRWLR